MTQTLNQRGFDDTGVSPGAAHLREVAKEETISAEAQRIQPPVRSAEAVSTIISLQEQLETVRSREIDRLRGRLGRLSPEQEDAIQLLTRGIINEILDTPLTVLKTASAEKEFALLFKALRKIFNLGEKRIA